MCIYACIYAYIYIYGSINGNKENFKSNIYIIQDISLQNLCGRIPWKPSNLEFLFFEYEF